MTRQTWLVMTVVILLLAFSLNDHKWCHCCLEKERVALLNINSWINPEVDSNLWNWDNMNGVNCCEWYYIECDNTTNRVIEINLSFMRRSWNLLGDLYLNASLFLPFQDLKSLDLSMNNFVGFSKNQGFEVLSSRLRKLEELDLSGNKFDDTVLSTLRGFTSIKILDLSDNMLTGSTGIYDLKMLEELTLGGFMNITDQSILLKSLGALPSLKILHLYFRNFNETRIDPGLKTLEELNLYGLNINGRSILLESLGALPSLKILRLDFSNLSRTAIGPGFKMLEEIYLNGGISNIISGSFLIDSLPSLKTLYLDDNNWNTTVIGPRLHNLTKLENLYLGGSSELPTIFLQGIGSLSALKMLSLFDADLKGTLPTQGWCELMNLEELDLSENKLEGSLPACLGNMTSLRSLSISQNQLVGDIASSSLGSLSSLEYLSIRSNHFEIPSSFKSFMNLSNLKFLSCDDNKIIIEPVIPQSLIPKFQLRSFSCGNAFYSVISHFLYTQHDLRFLKLSENNMSGMFPSWIIENNTRLEELYLGHNSFTGSLQVSNHSFPNLIAINISNNEMHGPFLSDICFLFPNVMVLSIANNKLSGGIPSCIGNMSSIYYLDLSNNFLTTGSLEQFISSRLVFLKLSNNYLDAEIPPSIFNLSLELRFLYLDGNNFKGQIWNFPFIESNLLALDISNNHLSGKLPTWISNVSMLEVIDLSKNQFLGHIPSEFCKLEGLQFFDLSENDLSGSIPSGFNQQLSSCTHIHLQKNRLSGQLVDTFGNITSLITLDLRYNNLIGPIPYWIGNLSALEVLLVKANSLYGGFPVQLCSLEKLSILDISQNKFGGALPSCLGNLSFQATGVKAFVSPSFFTFLKIPTEIVEEVVEFTTKRNSYNYSADILNFMSGVDLSCNNFTGEIPAQIGYLIGIHALNLSYNNFYGTIPVTLSNLQQIESLDLSYNKLNGRVPPQLTQLTTLEVFNVSYNNLSGEVPEMKNQFGSFDEYSYKGNPFLCGPLLQNHCHREESPPHPPLEGSKHEQENSGFIDMDVFYMSFGVCYIIMVLTIAIILCINPYWRRRWFYFIEVCLDTCYYFMMDCYYYVVDTFGMFTNFRGS